jgi:hypothetical protein
VLTSTDAKPDTDYPGPYDDGLRDIDNVSGTPSDVEVSLLHVAKTKIEITALTADLEKHGLSNNC